jgi:hypothetical protein
MAYTTDVPSRRRPRAAAPARAPAAGRRQPTPTPRRALELLAGCGPEGCAEAVMRAHGFAVEQLVELVRAGLATVTAQRVRAGGERVVVATLRITDAGWKPLKGVPQP